MAWEKSAQSLIDLFDETLPDDPRIERRKMFGYPSAFVHGNMYAGLFQDQMFVRLSPEDRKALEDEFGPHPFSPMPGRAMGAYVTIPEDVMADEAAVQALLAKGLAYTAALPAKEKAKPKPRPAKAKSQ
jgi:TfoX/Sxy family transcriptional regulator of competence genes